MKKKQIDKRKLHRVLRLAMKLYDGHIVDLNHEAKRCRMTTRTLQRDIYSVKSVYSNITNLGHGQYKVDARQLEAIKNELKR